MCKEINVKYSYKRLTKNSRARYRKRGIIMPRKVTHVTTCTVNFKGCTVIGHSFCSKTDNFRPEEGNSRARMRAFDCLPPNIAMDTGRHYRAYINDVAERDYGRAYGWKAKSN